MEMIKLRRLQFNDRLQLLLRLQLLKWLAVVCFPGAMHTEKKPKRDHRVFLHIMDLSFLPPFISIGNAEHKLLLIVFVYHFRPYSGMVIEYNVFSLTVDPY